jgi:hypothetical protein
MAGRSVQDGDEAASGGHEGGGPAMRKVLWMLGVLGVAMIIAPFALGFPSKASHGQAMLDNFRPLMQQSNVDTTASYYNDVFVPLGAVAPAMSQDNVAKFQAYLEGIKGMQTDAAKLVPGLAQALGMTDAQVQQFLATNYPAMSQMLSSLPNMQADFGSLLTLMSANTGIFAKVPAGLQHYEPLVQTMQTNVGNYRSVDSLPNFRLFTWFFVVPGVLMVGLCGWGLLSGHQFSLRWHHPHAPLAGGIH